MLISTPVYVNADEDQVYTTLRSIDLGTFNEYRYRMTEQFFFLREYYEVENEMSIPALRQIAQIADVSYKYLPDNLENKNLLNNLLIDIQRGVKNTKDSSIYIDIVGALSSYIEEVAIQEIEGQISASPLSGNAPLSSTLRAQVQDPSGTQILTWNYTWWVDNGGSKLVIGRGPTINYTFKNQGTFSIFLDVTSSHKNSGGNTDVLPLRKRVDIIVQEKIASLIINVNGDRVNDGEELKFNPDDANYGLIFDATSSTPTFGTRFERTQWDFGNGVIKSYLGWPKIERIRYGRQGDYSVSMRLTTNEGQIVETDFMVYVRDPIAKIEVNRQDGYIGDSFTFSAKSSWIFRDLSYNWEIIDIESDKVIYQKTDKVLTYSFQNKWKYNVQLRTRRSNGEIDQDTRIVYVTSQSPIAEFETSKPYNHKPNKVFFDATRSYDPDISDDGKLKYQWIINGNRVNLEESSAQGSIWYYTFESVGTQSIALEVTDPDGIMTIKQGTVQVESILSVEMFAFPRVIQRENFIKFTAVSPEAEVFEWNFWDGKTQWGSLDKVTHTYDKSGAFSVKLKVTDKNNVINNYTRTVYVSESESPFAVIDVWYGSLERPLYEENLCDGEGAYRVNRVQNVTLNANESININGENTGLEYSWKIGNSKYSSAATVTHRFDELGCFPVKLTVQSKDNGKTSSMQIMIQVENALPQLTLLGINVQDSGADPLIIDVSALGANDPDGVIQSYLWYYYTDIDTQPQDFRSSSSSSTTFVIPKITGNYYFVVILKDNNEARITSEEATWARYFTTITGDNINTPIVELSVNDTSTIIGDEVIFTAKAQNILGKDVSKDAEFSWDFDGDGFYDTQTNDSTTTYKYKKSWEFYAKVKVKYRGISSTKNITMNVSNKLLADFGYISIGNKYIFFDSSLGTIDSRVWNLWDGNKKSWTNFEYSYTDKDTSHEVTLIISEGTKVKEITKTVTKNVKNILETRGKNLVVFTFPNLVDDTIILDSVDQKFFVYLWESMADTAHYAIDYDIQDDSDLNGWLDDDTDNRGTASYVSGDIIEIPLNNYKTQIIRVYISDEDENIIASRDITITKTYIEEVTIDPDLIIFENVTESEKEKIETLKQILSQLPQQQRLRALSYIQKLQENWNDDTEKTRTILDFENYIFELWLENEAEFIELLESLLVEWQEDQSAKQITYQALVNLVPSEIVCETNIENCYEEILWKLSDIKNSDDVEYNKALGKEILNIIALTDLMTSDQKLDFKAILTSLVYGGDVNSIPEIEKQEVIDESPDSPSDSGALMWFFSLVLKIILGLVGVFLIIIGVFYLLYLLIGKRQNKTFTEFITRTTSFDSTSPSDSGSEEIADILWESSAKESDIFSIDPNKEDINSKNTTQKTSGDVLPASEEVPDWLRGSFSPNDTPQPKLVIPESPVDIMKDSKQQDTPIIQNDLSEKKYEQKPEEKKNENIQKNVSTVWKKEEKKSEDFDLEKDTKIVDNSQVPDWLKGSFTPEDKDTTIVKALENKSESGEETNNISPSVPDWLKWSFEDSDSQSKDSTASEKESPQDEPISVEKKKIEAISDTTKVDIVPDKVKKQPTLPVQKKTPAAVAWKTKDIKPKTDIKKDTSEELWDDGMKIPDWLKADDES